MTHYRTGADFERKVRDSLEADGYSCIRAAGSHGVVDMVALKEGQILLVQVKRTQGQIPPADRAELLRLAALVDAIPLVAYQPAPRKPIAYRRLTGPGPREWLPFYTDEIAAVTA
jgi:holliday junction resolvase Hjr